MDARSGKLRRFARYLTRSDSRARLVGRAQAPENEVRLRERTRWAKELGIFGAPSFVVGAELFWGNDRPEDAI